MKKMKVILCLIVAVITVFAFTACGGGTFDGNFKKKDGFKRSIELSKQFGIYRQNYCGCEFSVWDK